MADLPGQSGTGSSSTFVVGLINALTALCGERLTPYELYKTAIRVEQKMMGDSVGCQDQAWAAFGGFNSIEFKTTEKIRVTPILQSELELQEMRNCFMMFFTGINRTSSDIAKNYVPSLSEKETEHRELLKLAKRGIDVIEADEYLKLGELLNESWEIKKSFSKKVSNQKIDDMYQAALDAGALGGKLMGAGGGGCLLLCVPQCKQDYVRAALDGVLQIPFELEPFGSKVIVNDGGAHA
jgi:D-glycero-alpha-D-manno-heptose-7-phosphate kinase